MKKFTLFIFLNVFVLGLMAQPMAGISWVAWENEPDYDETIGYAENPYDKPVYTAIKAPAEWSYDGITDASSFEETWNILGDSLAVANLTSNGVAGDLFDLGQESPSFGAAWKAVHDGSNLYVLIKYWDLNSQADADSRAFEIMAQPTAIDRHEETFVAANDSAAELQQAYKNMAYARYVELGGGKAAFSSQGVSEYVASTGLDTEELGWKDYTSGKWGSNDNGLLALAGASHFWDADADGTIRAVLVMSLDGALAYPVDPTDLAGDYIGVGPGDTIAFDVKSNATVGGTEDDNKIEYFWSADRNNGYASNYYSGYIVLEGESATGDDPAFAGISWVAWENEPDYDETVGYADNPYDNPAVSIKKAPDTWSYDNITDAASFESTWGLLGDSMVANNLTSNGVAGDLFDLGQESPSFGAAWKGVHDGTNFYVLLKYWDLNNQADADSRSFEIMAQPTSPVRHEPTFVAAEDSAAELQQAYKNMAYARYVELGGGKAAFSSQGVSEYVASTGLDTEELGWKDYTSGKWGSNDNGLLALAGASHFWDVDADGTIRAVLVMSLDGALAYPADPTDMDGTYVPLEVGETFAFDVKSNATIGGTEDDNKLEYFWSADRNNGYASNYYSGHLTLTDDVVTNSRFENLTNGIEVYSYNNFLRIKGVQNVDVNIYTVNGMLVKSVMNANTEINISELPKGVYIVKLNDIPAGFKFVKE